MDWETSLCQAGPGCLGAERTWVAWNRAYLWFSPVGKVHNAAAAGSEVAGKRSLPRDREVLELLEVYNFIPNYSRKNMPNCRPTPLNGPLQA